MTGPFYLFSLKDLLLKPDKGSHARKEDMALVRLMSGYTFDGPEDLVNLSLLIDRWTR